MAQVSFRASGWRGIIAEDFTFTALRAVALAVAQFIQSQGTALSTRGVVVGYDTRFLSEAFALQAARVLAGQGVRAYLAVQETPTPAVASELLRRHAGAGMIITAGHDPGEYNGIKLLAAWGGPVAPEAAAEIQQRANAILNAAPPPPPPPPSPAGSGGPGLLERVDPLPGYLERLRSQVDLETIRGAHLRVAVDPLYGTAQGILDALLREAGCEVTLLHAWRDPHFGGRAPEPTETALQELAFQVIESRSHLGLATDGDGDRFGLVDADGSFVEPHQFLGLLLQHLVRTRGFTGGVARTVAATHLLDAVARKLEIPVHETVGFGPAGELVAAESVVLGGDESGRVAVKGHLPERDGILACLLAVELVASREGARLKALLQELHGEVGPHRMRRIRCRLEPPFAARLPERLQRAPGSLAGLAVIEINRQDGLKLVLEDGSWLLLSPAWADEGVVRIIAEAPTQGQADRLAAAGEQFIGGGD